jgi:cytochrome c biogenesis protein CcmG/thiol:disulfide interchange protein DsbE
MARVLRAEHLSAAARRSMSSGDSNLPLPDLPAGPAPRRRSITPLIVAGVAILAVAALAYAFAGGRKSELQVGQPAPAFRVATREGVQIDSQTLRSSVVVVNFFASWCKPCQEEAADLEAVWQDYKNRGVAFVGITYQDVDAKVVEFVQRNGVTYLIGNDDGRVARAFGVTGVPETYVIGRDGILAFKKIGAIDAGELRRTLDALLTR